MTKVFIDVGHGGNDSGAIGNGLKEKDVNLKIAKNIKKILSDYIVDVKLSREDDRTLTLKERTDMANKWGADYLLSVHINGGGGSGYEDFINTTLSDNSKTAKYRDIMHSEIRKTTNSFSNRGKKKANFHMLRESKMPALLTENGFIDNINDSKKLKDDNFIKEIARGHVNGLVKTFNLKKKKTDHNNNLYYRVVTGSFSKKENAESRVKELKTKGFDSFIDVFRK